MIRHDKQTITHTAGDKDSAVADGEFLQDDFVGDIIIIPGQDLGRVCFFEAGDIGHVVAVIIQHIRHKLSLTKHIVASIDILHKRNGMMPPGDLRIDMGTGKIFLARDAHFFRRAGKGMEKNLIETGTELVVHRRLHSLPEDIIPVASDGGKGLGGHDSPAVNMSG